jgi:hypothetical protein
VMDGAFMAISLSAMYVELAGPVDLGAARAGAQVSIAFHSPRHGA